MLHASSNKAAVHCTAPCCIANNQTRRAKTRRRQRKIRIEKAPRVAPCWPTYGVAHYRAWVSMPSTMRHGSTHSTTWRNLKSVAVPMWSWLCCSHPALRQRHGTGLWRGGVVHMGCCRVQHGGWARCQHLARRPGQVKGIACADSRSLYIARLSSHCLSNCLSLESGISRSGASPATPSIADGGPALLALGALRERMQLAAWLETALCCAASLLEP